MFKDLLKQSKTAQLLLLMLTVLVGVLYPLLVTLCAQTLFPWQANGSLLKKGEVTVGSKLIGQEFNEAKYFSGRPSSTTPYPYNSMGSRGSNLALSNPELLLEISKRATIVKQKHQNSAAAIPVDLLTASASGLDPEITLSAAYYQVSSIARARGINSPQIDQLINSIKQDSLWGIFGEVRVNVLQLNLALDTLIFNQKQK